MVGDILLLNLQVCRINLYTDLKNKVFNSSLMSLHPMSIHLNGNNVIKTVKQRYSIVLMKWTCKKKMNSIIK